ncbi:heparinase [Pedobacter kyungheensis]|uniref:Heparinase n=1 Tax=Pedobacter kyungheensis TaxID=1069985 RepID=A0A0C1DQH6_9SPHI|nr:heparinase II/III family protein [Pedobacter kyungheensis]KIA96355.1 heparinase [Pedobacter kyungheensis]
MKKRSFKTGFCFIAMLFYWSMAIGQTNSIDSTFKMPAHPRLLISSELEKQITQEINRDAGLMKIHQAVITGADKMLSLPGLNRIMTGKRLLDVSREALKRIYYLSYSYRLTHDKKYLQSATQQMLAVSAFTDWNPSHFLDVGEMTMAMAIGYDWLYNDLDPETRRTIAQAILEKGIKPSMDKRYNNWLNITNNWNQVCNSGITFGAIATFDEHPALSAQLVNRAIKSVVLPMKQYAPDGAYPEGYAYWEYGTSFNVMLISALESVFKQDFGLSKAPGFLQTAAYMVNMTGPSGKPFNYSDSRAVAEFNPALFWFASKSKSPSLLWVSKTQLLNPKLLNNRLLPSAILWAKDISLKGVREPQSQFWLGNGPTPVALMRSSWTDSLATFIGFKGGSPATSHAHMDVGSFVIESQGVRWAMDLGMQEYESLESKGIDLWNSKQDAQRWKIFRYNNLAHNTLSVDSAFQLVNGKGVFLSSSDQSNFMNAVVDMHTLYANKLKKAVRGVALIDKKTVLIRDEVETGNQEVTLRWSMVTPAVVKVLNANTIELTSEGKKCYLHIETKAKINIKQWPSVPVTNYDAPNPGTVIVGFTVEIPANSSKAISVFLTSEKLKTGGTKTISLAKWPKS